MKENEERLTIKEQKEKIRARYKGINTDEPDVIPAIPIENFYEDKGIKRVAVYVRVSTGDPRQTTSYELQKNYYTDTVGRHPGWELVEIYADEGISGTSLQHRDAFLRMIDDCRNGKIDLIVTKSVSRFSRNLLDSIGTVRELKALRTPIGVFFETENIFSLDPDSEMSLSFISTLAQEESHIKSKSMNVSIEMRFTNGILLTPLLLGYDHDEDGNLIINEDESKTIRLVFFMYLYGYTCQQIAETLTSIRRKTKKQSVNWAPGSILQILQNERHCGDVLARKTWTPSYLNHKSKKNKQDRNQYHYKNHHEAIISRDDFIAVQHLISNAKYGNKGILPKLHVIIEGALKGFVSVNPRWSGFTADDYTQASRSVSENSASTSKDEHEVTIQSGDFDLRGYEIARSQFFDTFRKPCVTFSMNELKFGVECIRKMNNIIYVELLLNPDESLLAIRPVEKDNRNAVKWAVLKDTTHQPRIISGTAFLKSIYEIFGWKADCKYRVRGIRKRNTEESVYVFDMSETEVFMSADIMTLDNDELSNNSTTQKNTKMKPIVTTPKTVCAYPLEWVTTFGSDYYRHEQSRELVAFSETGEWNTTSEGQAFSVLPLNIKSSEEIKQLIDRIIEEMNQKGEQI